MSNAVTTGTERVNVCIVPLFVMFSYATLSLGHECSSHYSSAAAVSFLWDGPEVFFACFLLLPCKTFLFFACFKKCFFITAL